MPSLLSPLFLPLLVEVGLHVLGVPPVDVASGRLLRQLLGGLPVGVSRLPVDVVATEQDHDDHAAATEKENLINSLESVFFYLPFRSIMYRHVAVVVTRVHVQPIALVAQEVEDLRDELYLSKIGLRNPVNVAYVVRGAFMLQKRRVDERRPALGAYKVLFFCQRLKAHTLMSRVFRSVSVLSAKAATFLFLPLATARLTPVWLSSASRMALMSKSGRRSMSMTVVGRWSRFRIT